jgi:hypothetical protein
VTVADTQIRERPIIFSAPMVCAILNGRKTQTRRVVKPQPANGFHQHETDGNGLWSWICVRAKNQWHDARCPFGVPGDHLWVRETWQFTNGFEVTEAPNGNHPSGDGIVYAADQISPYGFTGRPWRSPYHLRREHSRITLEIAGVRVELLSQISRADRIAEGFASGSAVEFQQKWDSLNAKRGYSWSRNPWVWVVEFNRISSEAA